MWQNQTRDSFLNNLKGSIIGTVLLILIIIASVTVILKFSLSDNVYIPLLLICSISSGVTSGYIGTRKHRKKGILNGILSSIFPGIVLIIGIITVERGFSFADIVPSIVLIICGGIGGIAAVNIKRKTKKR